MALYKRSPRGPWWIKFSSGGKIIRRSSGSTDRAFAEEFETTIRARFLRQAKLDEEVHTWKEATDQLLRESDWRRTTRATNEYALTFFAVIDKVPVADINLRTVARARAFVERTQTRASANRIMAVFKSVLRACVKRGWITHMPPVEIPRTEDHEAMFLTPEEFMKLENELPQHLKGPARFSVLTGLREANVSKLKWSQVDLAEGRVTVPSSHYKAKKTYVGMLSAAAIAVLEAQPRVSDYVFTFEGRPVTRFNNHAFRKARARAGMPQLRWHDLRHTFASWMAQSGASDRVLQQAGGWTSPKMLTRYAHLRGDDMRKFANAVGTKLGTEGADAVGLTCAETTIKQVVPSI